MKEPAYKTYEDLPLFLNAATVAKVLGVSPPSGYELMHEPDFPVLKIGSRMVVPKEQFIRWVDEHYARQMDELELTAGRQRVAKSWQSRKAPLDRL